jgi:hypothetical protein
VAEAVEAKDTEVCVAVAESTVVPETKTVELYGLAAVVEADDGTVTTIETSCVTTFVDSTPVAAYGVIVVVNV